MIILGIASEHCSSASLMIDGEIVGLIQEERLSKRKNQVAFPLQAVRRLIDMHLAGDSLKIDRIVFGGQISDPVYAALDRFSNFSVAEQVREQHEFWYPHFYEDNPKRWNILAKTISGRKKSEPRCLLRLFMVE